MHTDFTNLHHMGRSLGLLSVGALSALGALSLTHIGPAQAQSPGGSLASLVSTVNMLKTQQVTDEATIAALQAKTAPLSMAGTDLTITGVNVHIVDGSGATDDGKQADPNRSLTGLGNLIIGYNAFRFTGNSRAGSHNLVLGDQNNYGSFGGFVAGYQNTISGHYASVSGGSVSTAGGSYSSVTGGESNTANGLYSSIAGGIGNTTNGNLTAISGGNVLTENINGGWAAGNEGAVGYAGNFTSP